jgi:peptide/nickel transport system permease protein
VRTYIIRRILGSLFVVFAVLSVIFVLNHLAGSPATAILQSDATPKNIAAMNRQLGLDRPILSQYVSFIWHAVHGNFGKSYYSHGDALTAVLQRVPVTAELAFLTLILSTAGAIALASLNARVRKGWLSKIIDVGTLLGLSIPTFLSGLLLLLLFGLYWRGILPAGGWVFFTASPVGNLKTCVLPVIALSLPTVAIIYRSLRASMNDVLDRDYVSFGRAAGFREGRVIRSVVLPNAILPTTTVIGLLLGYLLGGSLIIETTLSIPGLGQEVVNALQRKDFPIASASIAVIAVVFVTINLIIDVIYAFLSPRIRAMYSRKIRVREI